MFLYPQQNRVVGHKNHHLLDMVCTLLLESSISPKFWVEVLSAAVYQINHLSSQQLNFDSLYCHLSACISIKKNYIHLDVFALFIFFLINVTSLELIQQGVLLWVIALVRKVIYVMMLLLIVYVYREM